jgi:hypothetical protein
MLGQLVIDGKTYEVPDKDDWTLDELGEIERLFTHHGTSGALRGTVWLVKHREDPAFTVEDAGRMKVGQIVEVEGGADPTSDSPPDNGGSGSSSTEAPEASGHPGSPESTT